MNRIHDLLTDVAGVSVRELLRVWMSTLDYQIAYYDPTIDPAYPGNGKQRLYIFWHEYMQIFIHLRHHCSLAMLLSRHHDADILERLAKITGFGTVRGSTRRGGAEAILAMMKKKNDSFHLTITPDGPRGPRRKMAPGSIYLASKLQIPLILVGVGYDRPWRIPTWDRFAVPRPWTRARLIPSPEITIPPHLTKSGIDYYTEKTEFLLNRLTSDAEDWAQKGYTIAGSSSIQPGPKSGIDYISKPKEASLNDSDE